ncbi:multiple epidermal growth factor-like domains protein 10 isoform X1 [Haliotis cracherodii]|uniref:multiple epidermal growth factor-like domains protein 10 isoform X1 n=2 Tax=Haliotis cracherodii TaxID=6455 RepID=UPI0039EAB1F6
MASHVTMDWSACWVCVILVLTGVDTRTQSKEVSDCKPGTFGWRCQFSCACRYGSCDAATGHCEAGCRAGRYGFGCQLDATCMSDRYGVNYTGDVDSASSGKTCLPWSDAYVAQQGYTKEDFPIGDVPENYCRNPRTAHGNYAVQPWCYIANGAARSFAVCDLIIMCECPVGLFGRACESFCHCTDAKNSCDKVTGLCESGCAAGWIGIGCQTECAHGKFGVGCSETCGRCYGDPCDHATGECPGGCTEGHQGQKCLQECPPGWYGRNCSRKCGNCSHEEPCHMKTGVCFRGCGDGYLGEHCVQTCPSGRYGRECAHVCNDCPVNAWCHHVTGECISTPEAHAASASTTLLIPIIVVSVIVLAALLIAFFCVIWIRKRVCTTREVIPVQEDSTGMTTPAEDVALLSVSVDKREDPEGEADVQRLTDDVNHNESCA